MEIKDLDGKVLHSDAGWVETVGEKEVPRQARSLCELLEDGHSKGISFARADLYAANLECLNAPGINLSGARLYAAILSRAKIPGANLEGADMYAVQSEHADMSSANLKGTTFYSARLDSADLRGADVSGANLVQAVDSKALTEGLVYNQSTMKTADDLPAAIPPGPADPPADTESKGFPWRQGPAVVEVPVLEEK